MVVVGWGRGGGTKKSCSLTGSSPSPCLVTKVYSSRTAVPKPAGCALPSGESSKVLPLRLMTPNSPVIPSVSSRLTMPLILSFHLRSVMYYLTRPRAPACLFMGRKKCRGTHGTYVDVFVTARSIWIVSGHCVLLQSSSSIEVGQNCETSAWVQRSGEKRATCAGVFTG